MHRPVMVAQVVELLGVKPGGTYVDCTVGEGGHAAAIMDRAGPGGRLLGLDWDGEALAAARERLAPWGSAVRLRQEPFSRLAEILAEEGMGPLDGVLFDLGVSSRHLDDPTRGFSYQHEGPLDMRMDRRQALTAADLVNGLGENDLAFIIARYGEERWARRIARSIVERRARSPLRTTTDLVAAIRDAIPAPARRKGGHPARRTFQALRIAVNRELEQLEQALDQAADGCRPGGRVCVISFHSLEDRIVKRRFLALARAGRGTVLTRRPLVPGPEEVRENPRSRSARLRGFEVGGEGGQPGPGSGATTA
ncbi:MAG: 16S rRNA (cytosine(1402)-N(4))-methyltransferase RsmH [Bacillota bacterium]|nr:16S rRNA (cytosine(1402)-N(4))-methyltransferase RsmH [Bacillota bacterium]MDI7248830.1 16S rRNA (cytosine(1402)-N(4))-methyltransferase RsmH [Bacillota bacterium]